jgi:hypothetical protein
MARLDRYQHHQKCANGNQTEANVTWVCHARVSEGIRETVRLTDRVGERQRVVLQKNVTMSGDELRASRHTVQFAHVLLAAGLVGVTLASEGVVVAG